MEYNYTITEEESAMVLGALAAILEGMDAKKTQTGDEVEGETELTSLFAKMLSQKNSQSEKPLGE
jgi:hypothetical protein